MPKRVRSRVRYLAVLTVASVVIAGCATVLDGHPRVGRVPNAKLHVVGDSGGAFDALVKNALSDIFQFWTVNFPKVSGGKAFTPPKGGLYSVDGLQVVQTRHVTGLAGKEGCIKQNASFIVDNGAFCRLDDSIVWDRNPDHLFAQLGAKYGPLMVALIFAHEVGHAISYRLGVFDQNLPTIDTESQADCAAGAWAAAVLAHQAPHFRTTPDKLDAALEGYLDSRDSTPMSPADLSHGDGFDRLAAVADGIDRGVRFCFSPRYFNRKFTERPFATDTQNGIIDKEQNGNEPLDKVLNASPTSGGGLQPDLNQFWNQAAGLIGKTFTDVHIAEAPHPRCGAAPVSEFGYCPDDNTVYYSADFARAAYNSLPDISINPNNANATLIFNQPSDFALGTLFVVGWGMAVRHQLFGRPTDDKAALIAASCYAGAYAKDINIPPNSAGDHKIFLSPPDMDEATSAMLSLVGLDRAYGSRGTTGLERIQAFVKGYNGGLPAC